MDGQENRRADPEVAEDAPRSDVPTPEEDRRPNLLAAADVTALLASMTAKSRSAAERENSVPFFPDHMLSEATAVFLVLGLVSVLCIFFPVGLDAVSDPMKPQAGARPDWYFFFIHGFLSYVPVALGVVAMMLGTAVLAVWPWLDRNPERVPRRRPVAMALGVLALLAAAAFTYAGVVR